MTTGYRVTWFHPDRPVGGGTIYIRPEARNHEAVLRAATDCAEGASPFSARGNPRLAREEQGPADE